MTYAQVRNAARAAAMASFAVLQAAQAVSPATEWAYEEFTNYTAKIFGAVPKVCFVLPDAAAWGTPPYHFAPIDKSRRPSRVHEKGAHFLFHALGQSPTKGPP